MKLGVLLPFLLGCALANPGFVSSGHELDFVLRQIGDYDLDLIGAEIRGREDVIYLQRRAPAEDGENSGCKEDDCVKFKAWAVTDQDRAALKDSDIADDSDPSEIKPPTHLTKRGEPKAASICAKTKIDGKTDVEDPIVFRSHPYPPNSIVDKLKRVYDFEDIEEPSDASWFKVKNIEKRSKGRDYVVEHILEWQMLLRFLLGKTGKTNKENEKSGDGDGDGQDPELCRILHMYWKDERDFDVVQEVKQGNAWVSTTKPTTLRKTSALEYVGYQYPGGTKKSPHTDEFVILQHQMNSRKEHLWAGSSISPKIALKGGKPSMDNKDNYKTMQFNLEHNKWWDNARKEGKDASQNEGRCQGIGKFRDVLGIYQYHQDPHVADILKKQIERVGKAFKTMEEDVLPNLDFEDSSHALRPKYVSLDLSSKWNKFMKEEIDNRIEKIEEWMKVWAEVFKDMRGGRGNKVKNLRMMFQKRSGQEDNCVTADDDQINDRIDVLLEVYEKRGKWKNPLS